MAKYISSLPNNTSVVYPGFKPFGTPVVFLVADKNHQDYPSNSVTLVTKNIIKYGCLDAREPDQWNPYADWANYGRNNYALSNIDQFLHKKGYSWWKASHELDAPPIENNIIDRHNPYAHLPGFMTGIPAEFEQAILPTTLKTVVGWNVLSSPPLPPAVGTIPSRKFFLLSMGEVGFAGVHGGLVDTLLEGTPLAIFNPDNASRVCTPTSEAVSNNTNKVLLNANTWFLRSTGMGTSYIPTMYSMFCVGDGGALTTNYPAYGSCGLRPACNIKGATLVSDEPDENGVYTILFNQPPTTPGGITVPPTATINGSVAISWLASTDPEGDPITYELERGINGAAYAALTTTAGLSFSHPVDGSMGALQYRVRAKDATGASGWATSAIVTAINNEAPVISGEDTDLGVLTSPPAIPFTVTDDPGDAVELDAYLDGQRITHEDDIPLGQPMEVALTWPQFISLPVGQHTIVVTATDSNGDSASRIYTFTRVKAPISGKRLPIPAPGRPTSIQVEVRHNAPNLILQACNNALDASPAWEAIVPGERLTFENTTCACGQWAVSVKLYAAATSDVPFVYVDHISGYFMMFGLPGGAGGESMVTFTVDLESRIAEQRSKIEQQQSEIDQMKALLDSMATEWKGEE